MPNSKTKGNSRSLGIVRKFFPDVEKVVNAKSNLTVDLRSSDVKSATRKKHDGCAMAVACQRQCKTDGAIVSTTAAYLIRGMTATRYHVPQHVAREIVAFDRSGAGFPAGEYILYKPYAYKPKTAVPQRGSATPRPQKKTARRSPGLRAALSAV